MSPAVSGCECGGRDGDASVFFLSLFFPVGAGLYILQLMSERLAPSARGGLSLSDGFPVSICQVRLCTARRSPLLSPGYLLPLSPAGSAAAPGRCQQRRRGGGRFRGVPAGRHGERMAVKYTLKTDKSCASLAHTAK